MSPFSHTATNIGILAHVDAGKTSLTERLLHDTGAIDRLGSVDAGTTATDTLALERARGITIRTAVAPFTVRGRRVNLVDTPGHADFLAEVERALGVLDGAVLVLSAVEGVQAQTRVLMRTLRRMRLPTLLFANKTDRPGARRDGLIADIRRLLVPHPAPLDDPAALAEALAEHDEALLADLVEGRTPEPARLAKLLAEQTAAGLVHPLCFGSALTGDGIPRLLDAVAELLPAAAPGDPDAAPRGTVFALEQAPGGERTALLRLDAGRLRERDRVVFHRREPDGSRSVHHGRLTRLRVVSREPVRGGLTPGNLARLRGLPGVRVGDRLGPPPADRQPDGDEPHFAHPALESVVRPADGRPETAAALHAALRALADQDPLIRTRALPGGATSVLLHGEIQKEVLAATLAADHGLAAEFAPSSPVYLERPVGSGEFVHDIGVRLHPGWFATVGLRIEPAPPGSGLAYRLEVERGSLPNAFQRAVEETVPAALAQGLHGWPVTDCTVTLVRSGFAPPLSAAGQFRTVTPLVLLRALRAAGSRVFEPCHAYRLTVPQEHIGAAAALLAPCEAAVESTEPDGQERGAWTLAGTVPARRVGDVRRRLPALAHGEALWISRPSGDRPVAGRPPERERTDGNPLDLAEYLAWLPRA
ncbi:GTP-binding protein [Mangrovactinospora gilvigrisea]|uniref:GTP-binding protein n=1 Tax=Mangrovactinospora gilvigrisea TaxID=1428644 RepID=A0A1J7BX59_9ACTN|nr:GTP-binding protein [Mangrovactinospora gilvigrisea]OIV38065.1 GTP-binding protein [Mangrovactinospora gilvigrisea]